jgi:hypothetical protein
MMSGILFLFLGVMVISCSQSHDSKRVALKNEKSSTEKDSPTMAADSIASNEMNKMVEESPTPDQMTSSAAVVTKIDSLRKFIRTAELNFKVKNVYKATHQIEDLTKSFGGFTTKSSLNNEIIRSQTKSISSDSSVEITEFVIKSNIEVRIPQNNLDTFLRSLTPLVVFINSRNVTANDIHLELLKSQLEQLRNQQFATETNEQKTKGITSRLAALEAQAAADAAKIDRLIMLDKVQYSTVSIDIYQQSEIRYEVIANHDSNRYEPSFWTRFVDSLRIGFVAIKELFLFAVKLWGVLLIGLSVLLLTLYFYKRGKAKTK